MDLRSSNSRRYSHLTAAPYASWYAVTTTFTEICKYNLHIMIYIEMLTLYSGIMTELHTVNTKFLTLNWIVEYFNLVFKIKIFPSHTLRE